MSKLAHSDEEGMARIEMQRVISADEIALMDEAANAFAMELLMPEHLLRVDAAGIDMNDDRAVERLARKYQVAPVVMAIRIGQLSALSSQAGVG